MSVELTYFSFATPMLHTADTLLVASDANCSFITAAVTAIKSIDDFSDKEMYLFPLYNLTMTF